MMFEVTQGNFSISTGSIRKNPPQSPFFNPPKSTAGKRGKLKECPNWYREIPHEWKNADF